MKLVVISNRGARFDPNEPQTGGLAAGLKPILECSEAVWMFSSDIRGEGTEKPLPLEKAGKGHVAKLDLPVEHYQGYYRDYSNSTLWPALHSLSDRISRTQEGYRSYREMNDFIARAAFGLQDRDAFWVHDYHLLSWSRKSEQRDKWSFCLTAGKIDPRIRRDDEQTSTAEPHSGFQGEGGTCRRQG
ncbi:trehalose-6-phosphate synthase [Bradyrhizobium frederickii]|uniref:trehalose-6-phosphate synthase n=1 Tax=Bradyrhizobium frederickii TaxID=2560054 RepID=UPI001F32B3C5|nr:trehalose-6-phosphate synthase [Bradyrhizobium frederickii]